MSLNKMLTDNYADLKKVAYNITGNKTNACDLITETYLDIVNKEADTPIDNLGFIKVFSKRMKNISVWRDSGFTNQSKGRELLVEVEYKDTEVSEPCKQCMFSEIDLFKRSLPAHESKLFELHYEMGVSCSDITKDLCKEFKYPVNKKTIEKLLLPIKIKIKEKTWGTAL